MPTLDPNPPELIDVAELVKHLDETNAALCRQGDLEMRPPMASGTLTETDPGADAPVTMNQAWRMFLPALAARLRRYEGQQWTLLKLRVAMSALWYDILHNRMPVEECDRDSFAPEFAPVLRLVIAELQADQPNLWRALLPPDAVEAMAQLDAKMDATAARDQAHPPSPSPAPGVLEHLKRRLHRHKSS